MVDEGYTSGQPITALQAAWNVTNAIQGMFIVGLPIAVKVSFEYSNIKKEMRYKTSPFNFQLLKFSEF